MTGSNAEAPIRIGELIDNSETTEFRNYWSTLPAGKDIKVRMSGLVWPESCSKNCKLCLLNKRTCW